jgi:galactose mutarotase-like enzyme
VTNTVTLTKDLASLHLLPERGGLLRKLTLVSSRGEPVEILWAGSDFDPTGSGWPMGGMPFLFPFAGRVFHEGQPLRYPLGGEVLHMPLHGFAYGLPWEAISETPSSVTCRLTDSAGTHALFPFAFAVEAHYTLEACSLEVRIHVESRGALDPSLGAMPIAPGWHPFFRMPFRPLSRLSECVLETSAQHKVRVTQQGAPGKSAPFPEDPAEKEPRLSDPLYRNLILANHTSPAIRVQDRDSKLTLAVEWDPADAMRYVVLWSREGEGFHCVEPWMSLPDPLAAGHRVVWLEKGESFAFKTKISLT